MVFARLRLSEDTNTRQRFSVFFVFCCFFGAKSRNFPKGMMVFCVHLCVQRMNTCASVRIWDATAWQQCGFEMPRVSGCGVHLRDNVNRHSNDCEALRKRFTGLLSDGEDGSKTVSVETH